MGTECKGMKDSQREMENVLRDYQRYFLWLVGLWEDRYNNEELSDVFRLVDFMRVNEDDFEMTFMNQVGFFQLIKVAFLEKSKKIILTSNLYTRGRDGSEGGCGEIAQLEIDKVIYYLGSQLEVDVYVVVQTHNKSRHLLKGNNYQKIQQANSEIIKTIKSNDFFLDSEVNRMVFRRYGLEDNYQNNHFVEFQQNDLEYLVGEMKKIMGKRE